MTSARALSDELASHSVEAAELVRSLLETYRYDVIVSAVDAAEPS